jgi:hypothetical protein
MARASARLKPKNVEKPTFQEMSISAVFASEWDIGSKEGEPRIKAAD